MPVVNPLARELVFKLVYYGPGLGGKTTTLQHLHATTRPEHRGKLVSLATPVDRTLYFDFLPLRLPSVLGMNVRLQLFTVPGQVYYNATRKLVLTGADGIVLVVDSQRERLDASLESLANLRENLREHGRLLGKVPWIIQWNKRDLDELVPVEELSEKMNPEGVPAFETVATRGVGVYEALDAIARAVLTDYQARLPPTKPFEGQALQIPEGGLTEALQRHGAASVPAAAGAAAVMAAPHPEAPWLGEQLARQVAEPGRAAVSAAAPSAGVQGAGAAPASREAAATEDVAGGTLGAAAAPLEREAPSEPEPITLAHPGVAPYRSQPPVSGQAPGRELEPPLSELPPGAFSLRELWVGSERKLVAEVERALERAEHAQALTLLEQVVTRTLAGAAGLLGGGPEGPREPAVAALALGLSGERYLRFRALVREHRAGGAVDRREVLEAYGLALELRLARLRAERRG